jgi:hypothetical protein
MNHSTTFTAELYQTEHLYEVSDEAVETAAGNEVLPSARASVARFEHPPTRSSGFIF